MIHAIASRLPFAFAVIAGTALAGCASSEPTEGDVVEDPVGKTESAFVGAKDVPGHYKSDIKRLANVTCYAGGLCSVRYTEVAAAASLVVNADGTHTCTGVDCVAASGTWTANPWSFSPYGAKLREWYRPGQASLSVYGSGNVNGTGSVPNVTGTYVIWVHFIHD